MRSAAVAVSFAVAASLVSCLPARRGGTESDLAASLQGAEVVSQSCKIISEKPTEGTKEIVVKIDVTADAQRFVATGFKELTRSETLLTRKGNYRLDHDGEQLAMALSVIGATAERQLNAAASDLAGLAAVAASVAKETADDGNLRRDGIAVQAGFGFAKDERGQLVGQYTLAGKIDRDVTRAGPPFAIAWSTSDQVKEGLVGVTWYEEPYFPKSVSWVMTDANGTWTNAFTCDAPVRTSDERRAAIMKKEADAVDASFGEAIVKADGGGGAELARYLTHVAGVGAAATALEAIDGKADGDLASYRAQAKASLAWICFTNMRVMLGKLRSHACEHPEALKALKDPRAQEAFVTQTTEAFRNVISTDGFVQAAFQGMGDAGTPATEAAAFLEGLSKELCEEPLAKLVAGFEAPDCQRL